MMNTLPDLNNLLFEQIERLNEDDLTGEALEEQLKKSMAIEKVAGRIVANSGLMLKAVQVADTNQNVPRILIGDRK